MRLDAVVFDLEIVNAIPQRGEPFVPGIDYCRGWDDHAGMGVAVLVAIDTANSRTHVFLEDNLRKFEQLVRDRCLIGFNSAAFDDKVLRAAGLDVTTTYDLKLQVASAAAKAGADGRAKGRRLDDLARANLGEGKSGEGALAPIMWQRGERGAVIDYCIHDTWLTARLATKLHRDGHLIDPVSGRELTLEPIPTPEPTLILEGAAA